MKVAKQVIPKDDNEISGATASNAVTASLGGSDNIRANPSSSSGDAAEHEATKRLASQGQWRTPPLPVFAAGSSCGGKGSAAANLTAAPLLSAVATSTASSGTVAVSGAVIAAAPLPSPLPTSPDEYARMLQEAYRRGAEAGKRATSTTPPVQVVGVGIQAPQHPASTGGDVAQAMSCPSFSNLVPGRVVPVFQGVANPLPTAAFSYPVAPSVPVAPAGTSVARAQVPSTAASGVHAAAAGYADAAPHHHAYTAVVTKQAQHPYQPQGAVAMAHHPVAAASPVPSASATTTTAQAARSVSLPDMSAYAQNTDDEEDKRKKRLARNRASARLRRLKKKNLVDSYEGEVGVLETALSKLRSHRWGVGTDHEALIEALSMERGQQPLTPEKRKALITSILEQQREQVANLMECQLENYMLEMLAASGGRGAGNANPDSENDEMAQLTSELSGLLNLTPGQINRISSASHGCDREIRDLQVVDSCLASMVSNEWLVNEGVDEVAGQFTSLLNPAQMSKLFLWSDHNAEAIEELDYVNAVPGGGVLENGPVFEFGIDEGIEGGEEIM